MAHFNGGEMAALGTEEFQEEEVWAVRNPRKGGSKTKSRKKYISCSSSSISSSGASTRAIPRGAAGVQEFPAQRFSAPVHIPDWSKILKKHPNKNLWDDAACGADDDNGKDVIHSGDNDDKDDDDDDDGSGMVPPHEYITRRLASTQIASFSMCEGVGGTLKGRDLSRLRNAILTKTGFIE